MQFACYLQNTLGLTRGERVAIMLPNILQYPVAMCGIFRAGLVVVNVNPLYTARELQHQLEDSGTKCVILLENFAHILENVIADTSVEHVVVTGVGDLLSWPKSALTNLALRYIKKAVPAYKFSDSVTFRQALKAGAGQALDEVDIGFADIAYLQYTGGTTGVSKGAMLSHRNMVYNVQQTITWQADAYEDVEQVIIITALPLYHIFSLEGNCLTGMAQGGENILITNPRDFEGFAKEMAKFKFNMFTAVNTLFAALMDTPSFSMIDFSHLRVCIGGGMAVQPAIAKEWKEKTGNTILQGYGLTETSPAAVVCRIDEEFTGTIGLPIPSTEVMIADDDGNPLAFGEAGEICIRGPQVMEGYWQRPTETAEVMLPDGWLRTGDVGRMDEGGYIFIADRKKDMILVSGFNVYPNEIENVIVEMEGVLEAAAIGLPHERSGEIVKVFVVRKNDSLTEQDIIDHCKENLTNYKRPRIVEFRDDLPKTNVGKILRRELRD
jgi:long-chain acyl-CoA synthetase